MSDLKPVPADHIPKPAFNPDTGFWEAELASEYQACPARVDILLPEAVSGQSARLPVLYILPVDGPSANYGDGLLEAKKADLANRHQLICVRPYFTSIPWYGDHIRDLRLRHESYFLRTVLPWIDSLYPTLSGAEGRWLIGFSKSGWGACTLLMRHPDVFGYSAAWDAPFMLDSDNRGDDWGPMGLKKNFGTREQMQQCLPTRLAEQYADWLKERKRLIIGVGEYWRAQCIQYHEFLTSAGVPHGYRDDLVFSHRWDTGWFAPLAEDLVRLARASS